MGLRVFLIRTLLRRDETVSWFLCHARNEDPLRLALACLSGVVGAACIATRGLAYTDPGLGRKVVDFTATIGVPNYFVFRDMLGAILFGLFLYMYGALEIFDCSLAIFFFMELGNLSRVARTLCLHFHCRTPYGAICLRR